MSDLLIIMALGFVGLGFCAFFADLLDSPQRTRGDKVAGYVSYALGAVGLIFLIIVVLRDLYA